MEVKSLAQEIEERWGRVGRKYRVAIVGCGRIARQHANNVTRHPAAELVALCDVHEAGLRAFGQTYGVSEDGQFTEHVDLMEAVRPDVVHVCTWPDTHAEITRAAAERGIHVYCEKPMALDLAEADGMIATCRAAGVVLGINHHRRGDARFLRAAEMIREGAIGTLRLLVGDHGGGGRRLMAMSTHLYDLFRFLAGDASWVFGHVMKDGQAATEGDVYEQPHEGLVAGDEVSVQFGFRSGVYAYHDGMGHVDVELAGTHGRMLFYEGQASRKPWLLRQAPFAALEGKPLAPLEGGQDGLTPDPSHAAWVRYPEGDGGRQTRNGPEAWRPLEGLAQDELERPQHAYGRMIDRFLRAVDSRSGGNGDEAPLCVGEDGRASMEMAMGVYASHFSGRRVALPLETIEHPLARYRRG